MEGTKIKDRACIFAPGDYVEVAEGELVNLRGRIQSVDCEKVVMIPDHEALKVCINLYRFIIIILILFIIIIHFYYLLLY